MKYLFSTDNTNLIITLDMESGKYNPEITTINDPNITLENDRIWFFENGKYIRNFSFDHIGTISGVTPTSISDAFTKLNVVIDGLYLLVSPNFKGSIVPTDTPTGTEDAVWIATQAGTYTNFGGKVVSANSRAEISRVSGVYSISQTPLDLTTYLKIVDGNKINPFVNQAYPINSQVNSLGKDWYNTSATAIGEIPGTSSKWVDRLSGYLGNSDFNNFKNRSEITQNESGFTIQGVVGDANDTTYVRTGKIRLLEGATITFTVAGSSTVNVLYKSMFVYDLTGAKIDSRIVTANNILQPFTYTAPQNVDIILQHKVNVVTSGYKYAVTYIPFLKPIDINAVNGTLGFNSFELAVPKSNYVPWFSVILKDKYINLSGQSLAPSVGDNHTDFIPVKQGAIIKGSPFIQTTTNGISFYTSNAENTFVAGVAGKEAGRSKNEISYTAPSDGFVRLFSSGIGNLTYDPLFYIDGYNTSSLNRTLLLKDDFNKEGGTYGFDLGIRKRQFNVVEPSFSGGMLSIIDDDGNADVNSYLYPLIISKGLKIGLAICGGIIEGGVFGGKTMITEAQLLSIASDFANVEILNHSRTHTKNLAAYDRQVQYSEIYLNHVWLSSRGILPESFVAPSGSYNLDTLRILSNFYESHYAKSNFLNSSFTMQNYEIARVQFGSGGKTVAQIKALIDEAILKNKWIVLVTHVNGYDHYTNWRVDFEEVCNYIVSSGIPCLKPTDAFRRIKNLQEVYGQYKVNCNKNIIPY